MNEYTFKKIAKPTNIYIQHYKREQNHFENKKMDEVTESRAEVRETKIEVYLHTEKLDFINYAYGKSLHYWKSAALKNFLTENEARELIESATRKVILVSKGKKSKV